LASSGDNGPEEAQRAGERLPAAGLPEFVSAFGPSNGMGLAMGVALRLVELLTVDRAPVQRTQEGACSVRPSISKMPKSRPNPLLPAKFVAENFTKLYNPPGFTVRWNISGSKNIR
jgi:hypothetical protein